MSDDPPRDADETAGPPCPMCGAPPMARFRPFCSKRCADLDLGRWLTDRYAVPAEEADDVDAEDLRHPRLEG